MKQTFVILTHPDHELPSVCALDGHDYFILTSQDYEEDYRGSWKQCNREASRRLEELTAELCAA